MNHTDFGLEMIDGFLKNVCGCRGDWSMKNYAKTAIAQIREKVGNGKVLLALSGGVDSSVAAALLAKLSEISLHAFLLIMDLCVKMKETRLKPHLKTAV